MIKKQLSVLLIIILTTMLSGCTLEDETAEKVIEKEQIIASEPTVQEIFKELCFNCCLGKSDNYDEIVTLYYSTLSEKDARFAKQEYSFLGNSDGSYLYQTEELNREFEKCMQKAISTKSKHYSDFLITRAYICSRISLSFYKEGDLKNSNYWARRAVNLVGEAQGNYILGRVFIRDDSTIEIGANYLAQSAHLGYANALHALRDNLQEHSVFNLFAKDEEK